MKLQIAKRDLVIALDAVSHSMAPSGTDISSHFLFRHKDGVTEVLTFTGRLFASCPLIGVVDTSQADAFTVEGGRLLKWVKAARDAALTLEYDPTTKVVTATSPRGSMEFESLDPASFSYWDGMWPDVVKMGSVSAPKLGIGIRFSRGFCYDKETQHPQLCLIECINGILYATDQKAMSLVEVEGLDPKSTLRIHRNDAGGVLRFLGTCGDGEVDLLEHERCLLFQRLDGAVFGVSRFKAKYMPLKLSRDKDSSIWWKLSKAEILEGVPYLTSGAAKDDNRLFFSRPNPNGPVLMGMKAMTGAQMNIEIPVVDSGSDGASVLPAGGFVLDYNDVLKVLGPWEGDEVLLGLHMEKSSGYVLVRQTRDGVDYTTVCAWLAS